MTHPRYQPKWTYSFKTKMQRINAVRVEAKEIRRIKFARRAAGCVARHLIGRGGSASPWRRSSCWRTSSFIRGNPMPEHLRPYLFYDVAVSICSTCFRKIEAKIVFQDGKVLMLKHCPEHGHERVLIADDVDYYRRCREVFLKTSQMPIHFNTPVKWGCPYDCGLCTDHEQHSCLTLVEIADYCNLRCPICYAASGPDRPYFRTLAEIERMLDAVVRNEGEPDVVQISGGEPCEHPEFFTVLELAKARPIRHLMVNTNGVRIANSEEFAERLASYMPDFEVYLQFDSLEREPLLALRGVDLRAVRKKALERLNRLNISTTLVVTPPGDR